MYTLTQTWRYALVLVLTDIKELPLPTLLGPFFAIIRSPLSTGPITSTALLALHSFFICGLIDAHSVSLDAALMEFSSTVSQCKFEASDSSGDEVVLLRIMAVIQACMCHDGIGRQLGDIEVCEMLETVLTTCCQMRLSGKPRILHYLFISHPCSTVALRRSSETTMHMLVRTVFFRLHSLDPATEEARLNVHPDDAPEGEIKLNVLASAAPTEHANSEVEKSSVVDNPSGNVSFVSHAGVDPVPNKPTPIAPKPECDYYASRSCVNTNKKYSRWSSFHH